MKLWIGLAAAIALSMGTFWNEGQGRAEAQESAGRFAFVTPTSNSQRLHGAVLNRPGVARVYASVVPGRTQGIRVRIDALKWSAGADRLAVLATERGRRNRWVFIYNALMAQEFARPSRAVVRDLAASCRPLEATNQSNALTVLQNNGLAPRGSVMKFRPGTGDVRGMNFAGWVSPNRFILRVTTDPELYIEDASGKVVKAFSGKKLGRAVPVFADYRRRGGRWELRSCLSERPAISAAASTRRQIQINGNGRLVHRGSVLVTSKGERLPLRGRKAVLAAGPN